MAVHRNSSRRAASTRANSGERELRERWTSPQPQCAVQQPKRLRGVAPALHRVRVDQQTLEARGIEAPGTHVQHVSRGAGHDDLVGTRTEQGAQPVHELLHRARRARAAARLPTALRSVDRPTPPRSRRPTTRPATRRICGLPNSSSPPSRETCSGPKTPNAISASRLAITGLSHLRPARARGPRMLTTMSHPPRAALRLEGPTGPTPGEPLGPVERNSATGTPIRRAAPRSHPGSAARAHASATMASRGCDAREGGGEHRGIGRLGRRPGDRTLLDGAGQQCTSRGRQPAHDVARDVDRHRDHGRQQGPAVPGAGVGVAVSGERRSLRGCGAFSRRVAPTSVQRPLRR